MRINISKQREIIDYLIIYLLLFISNGFILSIYSGTSRLLMYLGLVVIIITCNPGRMRELKIDWLSLLLFIGVLCNIALTVIVNVEGPKQLIITFAFFLVAFVYTMYYRFDDFAEKYIRVMSFLCVFSLIIYVTAIILPELVMQLPISYNVLGVQAHNAFFSTIMMDDYLIRNQGIFWEPGAYQTFINLALIFNLFLFKANYKRNLIIFGTTLFTTYSTTGFIVGLVIILAFILESFSGIYHKISKRALGLVCMIVILLIVGMGSYNSLPDSAKYQLFGKIFNYIETGNRSSTAVRIDAIAISFQNFLNSPIWGNGTIGMRGIALDSGYNMNTATIINWFAMFGIFMGLSMNYGIYRLCMKLKSTKVIRILLFVTFLLALISEDYVRNPSILVFVFYGYHIDHKKAIEQNKVASKRVIT